MDKSIKDEQTIKELLNKMPNDVANSFTEKQLTHLFTALGTRKWAKHSVDLRGTLKILFIPKRYYFVFLLGQNTRHLSRYEEKISTITAAILLTIAFAFCTAIGLLVLYLIKSALGINLFDGFSLGIWSWFKELWA